MQTDARQHDMIARIICDQAALNGRRIPASAWGIHLRIADALPGLPDDDAELLTALVVAGATALDPATTDLVGLSPYIDSGDVSDILAKARQRQAEDQASQLAAFTGAAASSADKEREG